MEHPLCVAQHGSFWSKAQHNTLWIRHIVEDSNITKSSLDSCLKEDPIPCMRFHHAKAMDGTPRKTCFLNSSLMQNWDVAVYMARMCRNPIFQFRKKYTHDFWKHRPKSWDLPINTTNKCGIPLPKTEHIRQSNRNFQQNRAKEIANPPMKIPTARKKGTAPKLGKKAFCPLFRIFPIAVSHQFVNNVTEYPRHFWLRKGFNEILSRFERFRQLRINRNTSWNKLDRVSRFFCRSLIVSDPATKTDQAKQQQYTYREMVARNLPLNHGRLQQKIYWCTPTKEKTVWRWGCAPWKQGVMFSTVSRMSFLVYSAIRTVGASLWSQPIKSRKIKLEKWGAKRGHPT